MNLALWTDDVLILSESEQGLQNMLNNLHNFPEINGLKVNLDKTRIMIFNKSGRHIQRFLLGGTPVETTREYKYLGFKITPSGEIHSGLKDLKDRALKAFMKLKMKLGPRFRKFPQITIKLFNTLVKPTLLYASDFWGILKMPKNNPLDTLFLGFCKQLLGVGKTTTNVGVFLDLGLVPLNIYAQKNSIQNWNRIAKFETSNQLVSLSYRNSLLEELTWPLMIRKNLSKCGMMDVFFCEKRANTPQRFLQRVIDIFHQEAFAEINEPSSKLRTYKEFKTEIGLENYLEIISCERDRINLSRLRLSNHQLMIEKGRHQKIPKKQRFCPICPNEIEDKVHFLTVCKCFESERQILFHNVNMHNKGFLLLNNLEKCKFLMANRVYIRIYLESYHKKAGTFRMNCKSPLIHKDPHTYLLVNGLTFM